MKCPHCDKNISLKIQPVVVPNASHYAVLLVINKAGEFPVEGHTPAEPTKQTYLPIEGLDAALEEFAEDLEFAQGDGMVIYAPKQYFKDKSIWISINKIIKAHGGKWITAGEGSHWEVPT